MYEVEYKVLQKGGNKRRVEGAPKVLLLKQNW